MHKSWLHFLQILTTRQSTNQTLQWEIFTVYVDGSRPKETEAREQRKEMKLTFESHRTSANQTETPIMWEARMPKKKLKLCPFRQGYNHMSIWTRTHFATKKIQLSNIHLSLEITIWVSRKHQTADYRGRRHGQERREHIFHVFVPSLSVSRVSCVPLATGGTQTLQRGTTSTTAAMTSLSLAPLVTH